MIDIFPLEHSSYLQVHLLEQIEIERLKWLESEKAGYDIGIHRARWMWYSRYRSAWVKELYQSQNSGIHTQHRVS